MDVERSCRVCWLVMDDMQSIFQIPSDPSDVSLALKLSQLISVQIEKGDGMPDKICRNCKAEVDGYYTFRCNFEQAESSMREVLSTLPGSVVQQQVFHNASNQNLAELHTMDADLAKLLASNVATNGSADLAGAECDFILSSESFLHDYPTVAQEDTTVCAEADDLNESEMPSTDDILMHQFGILDTPCLKCGELFYTPDELAEHVCSTSEHYQCTICFKVLKNRKGLLKHVKLHTDIYQCEICDHQCHTKRALLEHMRRHNDKPTEECKDCKKMFYPGELRGHCLLAAKNNYKYCKNRVVEITKKEFLLECSNSTDKSKIGGLAAAAGARPIRCDP